MTSIFNHFIYLKYIEFSAFGEDFFMNQNEKDPSQLFFGQLI